MRLRRVVAHLRKLAPGLCLNEHVPTPIAVAMSGGVDSSVVAGMLHREGERVIGMTMQLWNQKRLPEIAPDGAHRAAAARSTTCTMRVTSRSIWAFLITW